MHSLPGVAPRCPRTSSHPHHTRSHNPSTTAYSALCILSTSSTLDSSRPGIDLTFRPALTSSRGSLVVTVASRLDASCHLPPVLVLLLHPTTCFFPHCTHPRKRYLYICHLRRHFINGHRCVALASFVQPSRGAILGCTQSSVPEYLYRCKSQDRYRGRL